MCRTRAISGTISLYQMFFMYAFMKHMCSQYTTEPYIYSCTGLQLHQRLIQVSCTSVDVKDALLLTNRTEKVLRKLLFLTFKVSQEGVIFQLKPSFGVGTSSGPKRVLICRH